MPEMAGLDEGTPLFVQVAGRLAGQIADGGLAEGDRVPSSNELAAFYRINPATAAKGINVLTDSGLVEKRRGIGMFVAVGARARLLDDRRKGFAERYVEPMVAEATRLGNDGGTLCLVDRGKCCPARDVEPMVAEATRLGIDVDTLTSMIRESEHAQGGIQV